MKILVTGGRDYTDKVKVFQTLDAIDREHGISLLIEGGARGADALAQAWADARGKPSATFHARWTAMGKPAGRARNRWMLQFALPDMVVAFPGGTGTAHMCSLAKASGIPVEKT